MKKLLFILSLLTACSLVLGLTACGGEQGDVVSFTLHQEIELEKYDSFNALKTIEGTESYLVWKTSNKKVATVVNGEVQAVGEGVATITATAGELTAETTVTVKATNKYPVFSVDKEDVIIRVGGKITINGYMTFNGKAKLGEYSYYSLDESVATVDKDGKITALKAGETAVNVIAKFVDYSTVKKVNVKVVKDAVLELNAYEVKIELGKDGKDTFTIIPEAYLNNQSYTATNYMFSSSNPEVATADINGVIRGIKQGNAVITVSADIDGVTYTETISVIVFKNSVDIQLNDFEVFKSVNGNVRVPNEIEINLASYNLTAENVANAKVTYTQGDKTGTFGKSNVSYNQDKTICYLSGRLFGSEIYGENIVVTYACEAITVNVKIGTVVTKYISTKADFDNLIAYGNGNSQTDGIPYNGYFVMTNNIDLNGELSRRVAGVDFEAPVTDIDNSDFTAGFKGIFDGKGYTLYNFVHDTYKGGLFGNVSKDGVIQNLGVAKAVFVPHSDDLRIGLFGNNISGSITNCYIDVTVAQTNTLTPNPVHWGLVGRNLYKANVTDLVIKADLTKRGGATFVSLGAMLNNWPEAWNNPPKFNGVYVYVTEEIFIGSYATRNASGTYYVNVEKVYHYGYNEVYFAPVNDLTYWAKGTNQPIFITAQD